MEQFLRGMSNLALKPNQLKFGFSALDRPGYWRDETLHVLMLTVSFASLYAAFTATGFVLVRTVGDFVTFWPAAGLLAGMLSATPLRTWPLWLAGAIAGRVGIDLLVFDTNPVSTSLAFGAASLIEAVIFAVLIAKPLEQSFRLARPLYLMIAVSVAGVASSTAGGLAGAGVLWAGSDMAGFWINVRSWMVGDYLGLAIVAPLVIWWLLPQIRVMRRDAHAAEYLLFGAVALGILYTLASAHGTGAAPFGRVPGALAIVAAVPLVWAALRFEYPVVGAGLFILVVAVLWGASSDIAPLAFGDTGLPEAIAGTQLFLVTVTQIILLLAFLMLERERARQQLAAREGLERLLVNLSNALLPADSNGLDDSIGLAIREIADFANADRCQLFQSSGHQRHLVATHVWHDDGTGGEAVSLPADLESVRSILEQDGYVACYAGMGSGARDLANPARSSYVFLGLFCDGALSGCIGLEWRDGREHRGQDALALLYLASQLFANILQRLNAERELADYQKKLSSMARDISLGEERTRRRAAIDVHDSIGQNLAVARITLGKVLAAGRHDEDALRETRMLIDSALRSTRVIISDLSPAILYELGLVAALKSLADRFEPANSIRCEVSQSGTPWEPPDDLRVELYRVVRELLTNVAKHAEAESVSIQIDWRRDRVRFVVQDDGIGFKDGLQRHDGVGYRGFGIFSVREGIKLMGGAIRIESSRGIGTRIEFSAPRPAEEGPA